MAQRPFLHGLMSAFVTLALARGNGVAWHVNGVFLSLCGDDY